MTKRTYYQDTYCFSGSARMLGNGQDQHGQYWLFDKTIFHPQGGGQPSDRGTISFDQESISVSLVKEIEGEIRHYVLTKIAPVIGGMVKQSIDPEFRLLCSKLHSAGHLIAQIIEQQIPSAIPLKAFHFPEGPYIEVAGIVSPDLIPFIQEKIDTVLGLPAISTTSGTTRQIKLGDFQAVSCGGTHVKNTSEIGKIVIRGIKKSGENSRVKYALNSSEGK
jgi:alanyl-tRNA synthetase